jgi:hypothetical protein
MSRSISTGTRSDYAYILANGAWYRAGESTPFFADPEPDDELGYAVAGNYDGDNFWEPAVVLSGADG